MAPQEMCLPADPYVNGQLLETFLYKNASECPICFLYYPPYLNKTRCCDQAICSECFVQIKRPDPHPPEHHDDDPPTEPPSEDFQLVSEPSACPYCKVPEFGITYESPPFRRGLSYAHQHHLRSAMSSSSSISSTGVNGHSRRRNQSLSVDSPGVITTDHIRPDWSKKLADARAHALRRAAAATALHNAAYVLGNTGEGGSRFILGRRRRQFLGTSDGNIELPPGLANVGALLAAADRQQQIANHEAAQNSDLFPGRSSSRRNNRIDTLEELMMMEAIRQSIQAEDERKKKEDKDAAKKAKLDEKQAKKDAKEAKKFGKLTPTTSTFATEAGESSSPGPATTFAGKGKGIEPIDSQGPSTPVTGSQPGLAHLFANGSPGSSTSDVNSLQQPTHLGPNGTLMQNSGLSFSTPSPSEANHSSQKSIPEPTLIEQTDGLTLGPKANVTNIVHETTLSHSPDNSDKAIIREDEAAK
jgi:hypothetical protein